MQVEMRLVLQLPLPMGQSVASCSVSAGLSHCQDWPNHYSISSYLRLCNNTGSAQDCASTKCAPYIPAKITKTHEYSPSPVVRAQEERQQSRELHGTKYMPELTKY